VATCSPVFGQEVHIVRNIRVADPRDRVAPAVPPPARHRRRDIAATIPILLLVPALIIAFATVGATDRANGGPTARAAAGSAKPGHAFGKKTPAPSAAPTATATTAPATTAPASTAPTTAPSAAPTATTAPATAAPTATPVPTSAPAATPAPTPTPPPTITVSASSGDYILIARSDLLARPTSGTSWATLKAWADKPVGVPSLTDQNDQDDIVALAKAIVYARTGVDSYRTDAIRMLRSAVGTELAGDSLGVARNAAPLALAADFAGWRDPAWMAWIGGLRTWANPDRGYTLISNQNRRPNNWGTHAGASREAIDLLLGDKADLAKAAAVFKGWTGDRSSYAGFSYGDLSWQASPTAPVGINPVGAVVKGMNVDGILPDDMRRGGTATTVGSAGVSYTWEALQGALLQAELLRRAGYPSYQWGDSALRRAVTRMYAMGYPATGDDDWQPYLVNRRYGTAFAAPATTHPGKAFGFADWLFR
jgi:hypothetical protein